MDNKKIIQRHFFCTCCGIIKDNDVKWTSLDQGVMMSCCPYCGQNINKIFTDIIKKTVTTAEKTENEQILI